MFHAPRQNWIYLLQGEAEKMREQEENLRERERLEPVKDRGHAGNRRAALNTAGGNHSGLNQ